MNESSRAIYPAVQVETPMPANSPATLVHRGQLATMPGKFDHATATYLLCRFDYQAACEYCDGEHFEPIPMSIPGAARCSVGFVAAVDYHQTDVGPYREWILGIWVVLKGDRIPQLHWVNATSHAFYAALAGEQGFMFFSPKMILTEALPTEVGVEHYGIPKELGHVAFDRSTNRTRFEVRNSANQWVMRADVPSNSGLFARWRLRFMLIRAFGLGAVTRLGLRKELPITLAGSAKLCARSALSVVRADPKAEFLLWRDGDCILALNLESQWGQMIGKLAPTPDLVCHIPNVSFVLSGPYYQVPMSSTAT